MNNRTFAMIKPDAVRNGYLGKILDRIIEADFKILGAKLIRMTKAQAEGFYAIHRERPFFQELTRKKTLSLHGETPLVRPILQKQLMAQFEKILLLHWERMPFMVQIVTRMLL